MLSQHNGIIKSIFFMYNLEHVRRFARFCIFDFVDDVSFKILLGLHFEGNDPEQMLLSGKVLK